MSQQRNPRLFLSRILVSCITVFCISPVVALHATQNPAPERSGEAGGLSSAMRISAAQTGFLENRGQIVDTEGNLRPDIRFLARFGGATCYLRMTGMSHVFTKIESLDHGISEATGKSAYAEYPGEYSESKVSTHRVDVEFVGANPFARIRAQGEIPGVSHFYLAHCQDGITNVPSFERVIYENLYPGIDCIYTVKEAGLKYDFLVHPGADPSMIRMRYTGLDYTVLNESGSLIHVTHIGSIEEHAPVSFQGITPIETSYRREGYDIMFDIQTWDREKDLRIDPWVTYVGGAELDWLIGVACDAQGSIHVCGGSFSIDYPVKSGYQMSKNSKADAVITKFNATGQLLQWSTYIGGSESEIAIDVAIDGQTNIVVAGNTESTDFPTLNATQPQLAGQRDDFVLQLTHAGTLNWSTYFGGSFHEGNWIQYQTLMEPKASLVIDQADRIYLHSRTRSIDLPVPHAFQPSYGGGLEDSYLAKFTSSGALCWATYLGGTEQDGADAATLTPAQNVALIGGTFSLDFPVMNPTQAVNGGQLDSYICEFDSSGAMLWSTYLGGSKWDLGGSICYDQQGALYLIMYTNSTLVTKNAYQSSPASVESDLYLCKFGTGKTLEWATYFGGSDEDWLCANSLQCDGAGKLLFTGITKSTDFPMKNPVQSSYSGGGRGCFHHLFQCQWRA